MENPPLVGVGVEVECDVVWRCEREAPDCSCDGGHGYSLPHNHGVGSQVDGPRKCETTAQERKVRKVVVGGRC
jgi:hypothetical protein